MSEIVTESLLLPQDDDMHSIQALINSAVLDSNVNGGLRWPLGKDCSTECRYSVVGVSHTTCESFRNLNLRLRVWRADRFDYKTSSGNFSRVTETVSKLKVCIFVENVTFLYEQQFSTLPVTMFNIFNQSSSIRIMTMSNN